MRTTRSHRQKTTAAALLLAALATGGVELSHPLAATPQRTNADPFYCLTIRDGQGNPIQKVCVPSPWPLVSVAA